MEFNELEDMLVFTRIADVANYMIEFIEAYIKAREYSQRNADQQIFENVYQFYTSIANTATETNVKRSAKFLADVYKLMIDMNKEIVRQKD